MSDFANAMTPRTYAILTAWAEGGTYYEVARTFGISPSRIAQIVQSAFRKHWVRAALDAGVDPRSLMREMVL